MYAADSRLQLTPTVIKASHVAQQRKMTVDRSWMIKVSAAVSLYTSSLPEGLIPQIEKP